MKACQFVVPTGVGVARSSPSGSRQPSKKKRKEEKRRRMAGIRSATGKNEEAAIDPVSQKPANI